MTSHPPESNPSWRVPFLASLLLVSGACALVYQTAWLREFRLIFGGSTPATAAVLAVFMGGLGLGSAWFGRRADHTPHLLDFYARLELGIGISAGATPFLLDLARHAYLRTGGVLHLGALPAALAHLLLATLVLGVPCFLLGGTLPAATRWITSHDDRQRGSLGVLYGCNAFGALLGVLGATFWALENLGTRRTLWTAAAIHLLLGIIARQLARRPDAASPVDPLNTDSSAERAPRANQPDPARVRLILAASALSGFAFFAAELVWHRMLTPLLGGSVYCFGIILALVLLGIALGGWLYRSVLAAVPGRVHLGTVALLAACQALALALPWALGDRLTLISFHFLQWRALGHGAQLLGASLIAAMLVLLPSLISGALFPCLVALLGEGRFGAARHVGQAYAANTAGAIAGSLCVGFWLLPALTAPGCWQGVVALSLVMALGALLAWERPWNPGTAFLTLILAAAAGIMTFQTRGPSGPWRHAAIGYGLVQSLPSDPAALEDRMRAHRREVEREWEGRESSIAVTRGDEGWALYSNGKADGSAISDAGTQVMLGLIAAIQHPAPRSAALIGLGTGTSAGWLADVPGMEKVDVIELEPRVADAARDYFAAVNRNALSKTNLHLILGDAREVLLASPSRYDLVVSEPPNPYRAGVANLFTREYYLAVRDRLNPGGLFSQWLQGYQLSSESLLVVYATLTSVFPHVETWMTQDDDLVFVCHGTPPDYPLERIRQRLAIPFFAEALARAWGVQSPEGFLARHIANPQLALDCARLAHAINSDDRNLLEYDMARTQYGGAAFHFEDLLAHTFGAGSDQPAHLRGSLDTARLIESRVLFLAFEREIHDAPPRLPEDSRSRALAMAAWSHGRYTEVLQRWRGPARDHAELLMLAVSASRVGTPEQAAPLLALQRAAWPADADVGEAWISYRSGNIDAAVGHLVRAYEGLRIQPWIRTPSVTGFIELVLKIAEQHPAHAETLLQPWTQPAAAGLFQRSAADVWFRLATSLPAPRRLEVLQAIGTHHPWTREFLEFRASTLQELGHPYAPYAQRDLDTLLDQQGRTFQDVLPEPAAP